MYAENRNISSELAVVGQNPTFISTPHLHEPFSKHSNLFLDSQINRQSEYAAASGGTLPRTSNNRHQGIGIFQTAVVLE
jgi:hypothetical protein